LAADGSTHVGPAKIKTLTGPPHMLDHFVVIRWAYFEKAALLTETTRRSQCTCLFDIDIYRVSELG